MKLIEAQIKSWKDFWANKFFHIFRNSLKQEIGYLQSESLLENFSVNSITPLQIKSPGAITEQNLSSKFLSKTDLEDITVTICFSGPQYFELFLGQIPKMTDRGTFIINGEERRIIGWLGPRPGLFFSKEISGNECRYIATFVPDKGNRIKLEVSLKEKKLKKYSPFCVGEIDIDWFKKENEVQYKLINDILKKFKINLKNNNSITPKRLTKVFNKLIRISNLIPLLNKNKGMSYVRSGVADKNAIVSNKQKMLEIYPHTLGKRQLKLSVKCGYKKRIAAFDFLKYLGYEDETIESRYGISRPKNKARYSSKKVKKDMDSCFVSSFGRDQIKEKLQGLPGISTVEQKEDRLTISDISNTLKLLEGLTLNEIQEQVDCLRLECLFDDKYSLSRKRIHLIGNVIEPVVEDAFKSIWSAVNIRIKEIHKEQRSPLSLKIFMDIFQNILEKKDREKCLLKFTRGIIRFFSSSPLSRIISHMNLMETVSLMQKVTFFRSEGDIYQGMTQDRHLREIHWSYYGRICPVDTSLGEDVGLTFSLTKNADVDINGIIRVPYEKIIRENEKTNISSHIEDLSVEDEKKYCIAYAGQEKNIEDNQKVLARKAGDDLVMVESSEIDYIEFTSGQQFGWTVLLIPFFRHNDANRATMAVNEMKQTLPLQSPETPMIYTIFEKKLLEETRQYLPAETFSKPDNAPRLYNGRNLIVGYMPYYGYNFEDAIVISKSAAEKLCSIEYEKKTIEINKKYKTCVGRKTTVYKLETTKEIPNPAPNIDDLDENGIIKSKPGGTMVCEGDVLVGKVLNILEKGKNRRIDLSVRVGSGEVARVVKVESSKINDDTEVVTISLEKKRKVKIGDKLANRHGNKGVISLILPDNRMPYFRDKKSKQNRPLEVILNPLGVFSRTNIGQLYETHLGLCLWKDPKLESELAKIDPLEDFSKEKIKETLKKTGLPGDGKMLLYQNNPRKNEIGRVVVGSQFVMRLIHTSDGKMTARHADERYYSWSTQQPLQGKKFHGGQRIGEMEMWALESYNARNLIQEMTTLRSDNPPELRKQLRNILCKGTSTQLPYKITPDIPEFLRVTALFLRGLGIDLKLYAKKKEVKILPKNISLKRDKGRIINPDTLTKAKLSLLKLYDDKQLLKNIFCGEIKNQKIGSINDGYNNDGLFSQTVFGPVSDFACRCSTLNPAAFKSVDKSGQKICPKCKIPFKDSCSRRYRMGFIKLKSPVLNPIFFNNLVSITNNK